jgi:hypothetical protein
MTTGEKLSSFVTRHPHVAKFTVKLSMHHGLCGVRRTPPQPKLPPRPRMQLLLAVALSLVTTTAIFAELSGHYPEAAQERLADRGLGPSLQHPGHHGEPLGARGGKQRVHHDAFAGILEELQPDFAKGVLAFEEPDALGRVYGDDGVRRLRRKFPKDSPASSRTPGSFCARRRSASIPRHKTWMSADRMSSRI